jgi:hypothetical protein
VDAVELGAPARPGSHTTDDLGSLLVHLIGQLLETAEPLDTDRIECGEGASGQGVPSLAAGVP